MLLVLSALPLCTLPAQTGHIFVLNTKHELLACDGWLCPVSRSMETKPCFDIKPCEKPDRPVAWGAGTRVVRCRPRTDEALRERQEKRYRRYDPPRPYLALLMGAGNDGEAPSVALLMQTLREFLSLVAADLKDEPSRFYREVPLVALPIFGAGRAADDVLRGDPRGGEIISAMIHELHAFTSTHAIDIALCTVDPAAFGAALQARRQMLGALSPDRLGRLWRLRAPHDVASIDQYNTEVDALAQRFLDGQVSLFLGAGVSINAGLPSWAQLIDIIALELGLSSTDRTALTRLNPLEAASVLADRAGGEPALKELTARIIGSAKRHSLQVRLDSIRFLLLILTPSDSS